MHCRGLLYGWTISPDGTCFPEYCCSQSRAASSADDPFAVAHLTRRPDF
jgi:hypothetical protein